MTTKELSKAILRYLEDSNRPFSISDIIEKCGKDSGKSAVQRAIDSLVTSEKIVEKQFGKQKIYFIRQDDAESNAGHNELNILEQKLTKLNDDLKSKEDRIKQLEIELKKFTSLPSLSELENERDNLKITILQLTENLQRMKSSQSKPISSVDLKKVEEKHGKVLSAYRKRKRICNDMIDAILEGYPKTKKHLIEEVGIETDESVGFKLDA